MTEAFEYTLENYPYYNFGQWAPDGKWEFWHGQSRFVIFRMYVRDASANKNDATQRLVAAIKQNVNQDLARQNFQRNHMGSEPVEPTVGAIAFDHWAQFISPNDVRDSTWAQFCTKVKPLVLTWINASDEMWCAYALQVSEGEHEAVVSDVGSELVQFDSNPPMLITGDLDMSVGDTGID
jgi:hypothetical protein